MKRVPPAVVPAALARRAKKAAALGHARHEARARELVALVVDKKREIAAAFWDVGAALRELASPELYGALGHATFEDAVEKETGVGRVLAAKLVSLATRLPRSLAERLGQEKAAALLRLADARGESDVTLLATKKVRLPGRHEPVRPIDLGANELKRAVRDEQIARGKGAALSHWLFGVPSFGPYCASVRKRAVSWLPMYGVMIAPAGHFCTPCWNQ
jgi:hypothetical protein